MFKITSHAVPLCPKLVLLDIWLDFSIPVSTRNLISLLLLAARCVLARKWKSSHIPSVKEWYAKIWDFVIANKLSDGILFFERSNTKANFLEK